jgi:hypothetical protein
VPGIKKGLDIYITTINTNKNIKHILASAEFRNLPNNLKVVALIENYGLSQTTTANILKIGRKQVRNMLKAHHEKKECNIFKRPLLLQQDEKSEFIQ